MYVYAGSDCRQSYESALQFTFDIMQLYIERHASLAASAAAAETISLQTTRDTVMLLAEEAIKSVRGRGIGGGWSGGGENKNC